MLSLVGYLMAKGSSLESSNKAGKTGRDAVLTKGSPVVILKMLEQFLIKSLGEASCSSSCMGRSDCNQPSVFQLQCPHKPAFKACSKCFLLRSQQVKCGCDEEDFESIQGPGLQQLLSLLSHRQPPKEKPADASQHYPTNFTFIKASGGDVRDQFGNIYTYQECENGVCRRFRCDKGPNFKERCTAVVAEIKIEGFDINSPITGYKFEYCLEKPHDHPVAPLKRKIHDEEGAGPSTLKWINWFRFDYFRRLCSITVCVGINKENTELESKQKQTSNDPPYCSLWRKRMLFSFWSSEHWRF